MYRAWLTLCNILRAQQNIWLCRIFERSTTNLRHDKLYQCQILQRSNMRTERKFLIWEGTLCYIVTGANYAIISAKQPFWSKKCHLTEVIAHFILIYNLWLNHRKKALKFKLIVKLYFSIQTRTPLRKLSVGMQNYSNLIQNVIPS